MNKVVVILLIVLCCAAAAGGTFYLMKGKKGKISAEKAHVEEPMHNLALEERTVNLAGAKDESTHYLKLTLVLELKGKCDEKKLEKLSEERTPKLMNCLIEITSKYSYEQLLTSEGKRKLKEELLKDFGDIMHEDGMKVNEVLFTDFVME